MDSKEVTDAINSEIVAYAQGRARDVERGAETPELAGLLVQKYGLGLLKGAVIASRHAISPNVLDHETSKIDPDWQEHMRQRWEARPAGVLKS